jgi:hypothetical protein
MRRIKTIGLCLVAVFAFSAMVASAAQAGEVGECLKLSKNAEKKYTGKYTDKGCTKEATSAQKTEGKVNKYEWSPGVAAKNAKFTAVSKKPHLEGAGGNVECAESTVTGEYTGPKTALEQARFTGCEFKGTPSGACVTAGDKPGEVNTVVLGVQTLDEGEHGDSGGTVGKGEVWDQFANQAGPENIQAEYTCSGILNLRTAGSLSGPLAAKYLNKMEAKEEISFNKGEGEQDLFSEFNVGEGWMPAGPSVQNEVAKITNSGKVEIRS